MLIPTKFTRLEESIIFKMKCILDGRVDDESVEDLYARTKREFNDASEFIYALDVLFVLSVIDLESDSEIIKYA